MNIYIIQICSGIIHGRVLNGELYAQRLQKLIYLHLSTDSFIKRNLHETVCRQMQIYINLCNLHENVYEIFFCKLSPKETVYTTDAKWMFCMKK